MSYNCDIEVEAKKDTLEILSNGLDKLTEANIEILGNTLIADFREDCSGVIYDLAKQHSLSFSLLYNSEDEEDIEETYLNGNKED